MIGWKHYVVWMEEDSGNEDGKGKNDKTGIGDQHSVIKGSNTRGKGINWELLDQFNFI